MRRIAALVLLCLVATVLTLVAPTPQAGAQSSTSTLSQEDWHDPGHTTVVNSSGDGAVLALKANGDLYVRRFSAGGTYANWVELGVGNWASGDIAIDDTGRVEIAAVKLSGHLFTRSWTGAGVWGPWTKHGQPTWDVNAPPAVATSGSRITFAAVKSDGRVYTRERNVTGNVAWGAYKRHGLAGWTQVDIAMASNGTAWLIGTKDDGRLFTRSKTGATWGSFGRHGAATWEPATAPSIAARRGEIVFGAVKDDGRMYTRTNNGSWGDFIRHGRASWTGVSVDMSSTGTIGVAATKDFGRLYTRTYNGVGWSGWQKHGADTWSISADPSISVRDNEIHVLAVKDSGVLYSQSRIGASWGGYVSHGDAWEAGMAGTPPPPPPPPPGGDDAAQINSHIRALSYDADALTNVQQSPGKTTESASIPVESADPNVVCTTTEHTLSQNFGNVSILRAAPTTIWPGSLVQGNASLMDGLPQAIGTDRGPVTLSIDLPGIGSMLDGPIRVEEAAQSTTQIAVDRALDIWNTQSQRPDKANYVNAGGLEGHFTDAYSATQLGIDAGLNVEWGGGNTFAASLEVDTNTERRVVTQTFKQVFYTVSVDTPSSPADFFPEDATAAEIRSVIDSNTAPAYVSSVSYGRILMVRMETDSSTTSVKAEAALDYRGSFKADAEINVEYENILDNSSIKVFTMGGNPGENVRILNNGGEGLREVINDALYGPGNPGVPIGYTVDYIQDNSRAKLGYTTDYTATECVQVGDRIQLRFIRFHVIENCDPNAHGEFRFRATVHAGHQYANTPAQIGSEVLVDAQLENGEFINQIKDFTFDLDRGSNPNPPRFGIVFRAWEFNGDVADSRLNGDFDTSWHTYQPATETWDHPPKLSTGLGGTYPRTYIARIGAPGSGCVVDAHYVVMFDGIEI